MQWSNLIRGAVATLSVMLSSASASQEVVTYKQLAADLYPGEGDTAVLLLHGTLAHNRMEIITTLSTLLSEDFGITVLAPNLSLNDTKRMGDAVQISTVVKRTWCSNWPDARRGCRISFSKRVQNEQVGCVTITTQLRESRVANSGSSNGEAARASTLRAVANSESPIQIITGLRPHQQ